MTRLVSSTGDSTCASYLNGLIALGADNPITIALAPLAYLEFHLLSLS
jgi:hypothetical protein